MFSCTRWHVEYTWQPFRTLWRTASWKIFSHVPSNARSGPRKLATCAGWHRDYWKMSQVSQAFYCHCCQVGFSMTSQKCNGKTLPVKEWKKLLRTLLWWSVGGLEMTASLGEIPRVLQILVLFVRYKFQALADNGCALMRGKSGGTLWISPARAYFTNLPYREPPSTTRVSRSSYSRPGRDASQNVNEMMGGSGKNRPALYHMLGLRRGNTARVIWEDETIVWRQVCVSGTDSVCGNKKTEEHKARILIPVLWERGILWNHWNIAGEWGINLPVSFADQRNMLGSFLLKKICMSFRKRVVSQFTVTSDFASADLQKMKDVTRTHRRVTTRLH